MIFVLFFVFFFSFPPVVVASCWFACLPPTDALPASTGLTTAESVCLLSGIYHALGGLIGAKYGVRRMLFTFFAFRLAPLF